MAHILVVDDDPSIRTLVRTLLENDGHQVEEAADGKQALLCFRKNPADLVITDVLMPEKDGLELILELKEGFPNIKIITMSGGGGGMDAQFSLKLTEYFGVIQRVEKPFTCEQMSKVVHHTLFS